MADDLIFPPDDVSNLIGGFETNLDELLDIPPLVPAMETMTQNMHRNHPISSNQLTNSISSLPANNTGYRPITQLMRQTQELSSAMGSPLSSSLNQQHQTSYSLMNSTTMMSQHHSMQNVTSNLQNQLVRNNVNYINPNIQKSSQFLVVGGQRIQTQPSVQQHSLQPSNSPLQGEGSPVFDIGVPSIKQNTLSLNNNKSNMSNSPVQLPIQQMITTNSQQKNAIVLKTPQQQAQTILTPSPCMPSTNATQIQQNGVVIKTANQQLMFVTEVNGKKVGYLIPNQKPSVSLPSSPNFPVAASSRSPLQNNISHHQQQSAPQNSQKAPSLESIKPTIVRENENKSAEMAKTIKERLQGLRNNGINLKSHMILNREKSGKTLPTNQPIEIDSDPPTTKTNESVSRIISDFDETLSDNISNFRHSLNSHTSNKIEVSSVENRGFVEEEEGQEIEFSENDLTADVNEEDSDEPVITSISVKQCNEIEDITAKSNEDEDEDSVPLALLKHDPSSFEEPISIVCENSEDGTKSSKRLKNVQDDSVPLSVVAASLKRDQEAPKKKKRGRKKKDKDEPPRLIELFLYLIC